MNFEIFPVCYLA